LIQIGIFINAGDYDDSLLRHSTLLSASQFHECGAGAFFWFLDLSNNSSLGKPIAISTIFQHPYISSLMHAAYIHPPVPQPAPVQKAFGPPLDETPQIFLYGLWQNRSISGLPIS